MSFERSFSPEEPEDIFAEAITRIEAGEPLESVLASYPAEHQAELRELLFIVVAAEQLQHAACTAARRRPNVKPRNRLFCRLRPNYALERAVTTPRVAAPEFAAGRTMAERWQIFWLAVQSIFTVRTMRLAPLILVLTLVLLSSFSRVTLAAGAVPGDLTYPMKE